MVISCWNVEHFCCCFVWFASCQRSIGKAWNQSLIISCSRLSCMSFLFKNRLEETDSTGRGHLGHISLQLESDFIVVLASVDQIRLKAKEKADQSRTPSALCIKFSLEKWVLRNAATANGRRFMCRKCFLRLIGFNCNQRRAKVCGGFPASLWSRKVTKDRNKLNSPSNT